MQLVITKQLVLESSDVWFIEYLEGSSPQTVVVHIIEFKYVVQIIE